MKRPSRAFSFSRFSMEHPVETHKSKNPSVKAMTHLWPTSDPFQNKVECSSKFSVSYSRRITVRTFWPRRSWTCWPDWWAAWRLRTQPKMKVAFGSTCFPPTKRRRKRRESLHLRCTPNHTLIHNSLTFASVDRGTSAGAHESLFGVVNIQAMQVQLGGRVISMEVLC